MNLYRFELECYRLNKLTMRYRTSWGCRMMVELTEYRIETMLDCLRCNLLVRMWQLFVTEYRLIDNHPMLSR